MFFLKINEKEGIDQLTKLEKYLWKINACESDTWKEMKKLINRMRLNPDEHPFLYDFRKRFRKVNCYNRMEMNYLLEELYRYKRTLNDN